jgi:hypothetical protein
MDKCVWSIGGIELMGQSTWRKAVQVPVYSPQIPYGLAWDQTQVSK